MTEELSTGATGCAERPVPRARNPKVKGNRVRACAIAGKRCDSIKDGFEELKELKNGISYWKLYRALRRGDNHIQGIPIELIGEISGWRHDR